MSNAEETLEVIEIDMQMAKEAVELKASLERLHANPDFKALIAEHYFKEYASNVVLNKAHPNQDSPEAQNYIMKQIDAIGMFRQYLAAVRHQGIEAEKSIAAASQAQTEILETDEEEELAAEEAIA